jgi:thioredoxin-related protein
MKILSFFLLSVFLVASGDWGTDFEKAKQTADQEHKFILLNFSGSDWCGPCIRMRKEIFEADGFKKYADASLVLVNADFPRLNKNQLTKDLQKHNDHLADKYNPDGIFPLTILLTADGKVIKKWEGFPSLTPDEFVSQVKFSSNGGQ